MNKVEEYLKKSEEVLRKCIDSAIDLDEKLYYLYFGQYEDMQCPMKYDVYHKIICNKLKNVYKQIELIDTYSDTENDDKINEKLDYMQDMLRDIIGGFYAIVSLHYDCQDEEGLRKIAENKYEKMYIDINLQLAN